ncbi:MAG: hypothetical protein KKD44_28590, partial [Proteobacteria bacterium]|nr:hypothetical protein [Pseudomonadota bacterium]
FDPLSFGAEDLNHIIRVANAGFGFGLIPKPLVKHRLHWGMLSTEIYRTPSETVVAYRNMRADKYPIIPWDCEYKKVYVTVQAMRVRDKLFPVPDNFILGESEPMKVYFNLPVGTYEEPFSIDQISEWMMRRVCPSDKLISCLQAIDRTEEEDKMYKTAIQIFCEEYGGRRTRDRFPMKDIVEAVGPYRPFAN